MAENSRQKAPCAYAKTGKSKPKNIDRQSNKKIPTSPRNKLCQNIYDDLMNELDLQESQYIQRLCRKNEEKMRKIEESRPKATKQGSFRDITNFISESSQKSVKDIGNQVFVQRQNIFTKTQIKDTNKQRTIFQKQPNPQFLNNLDDYIVQLNQNQDKIHQFRKKPMLNQSRSREQRQFRKTVDFTASKPRKQSVDLPTYSKYSVLLDKLHEQLAEKEALYYKIQSKDAKMSHLKEIVQSMHQQIIDLRRQLKLQKNQKEKYSSITQEFVSKVSHVRKNSKDKHYIPHHYKRNSDIPSSNSSTYDFSEYFNKVQHQQSKNKGLPLCDFQKTKNKYTGSTLKKYEASTLKKKGMQRYKMSQTNLERNDQNQLYRVSIYQDSQL